MKNHMYETMKSNYKVNFKIILSWLFFQPISLKCFSFVFLNNYLNETVSFKILSRSYIITCDWSTSSCNKSIFNLTLKNDKLILNWKDMSLSTGQYMKYILPLLVVFVHLAIFKLLRFLFLSGKTRLWLCYCAKGRNSFFAGYFYVATFSSFHIVFEAFRFNYTLRTLQSFVSSLSFL